MLKSEQFKEFLLTNMHLVDKLNIEHLYKLASQSSDEEWSVADLTEALIECGLRPLEHMTIVPNDYAFCRGKFDLTIPDNITEIKDCAFSYCTDAINKELVIPSGCYEIGPQAFQSCMLIESLVISEGVSIIDNEAFYSCVGLQKIKLPSTLKWIGQDAFADITYRQKLRKEVDITYNGSSAQWNHISQDGFGGTRYVCHCSDRDVYNDGNNHPFGHN